MAMAVSFRAASVLAALLFANTLSPSSAVDSGGPRVPEDAKKRNSLLRTERIEEVNAKGDVPGMLVEAGTGMEIHADGTAHVSGMRPHDAHHAKKAKHQHGRVEADHHGEPKAAKKHKKNKHHDSKKFKAAGKGHDDPNEGDDDKETKDNPNDDLSDSDSDDSDSLVESPKLKNAQSKKAQDDPDDGDDDNSDDSDSRVESRKSKKAQDDPDGDDDDDSGGSDSLEESSKSKKAQDAPDDGDDDNSDASNSLIESPKSRKAQDDPAAGDDDDSDDSDSFEESPKSKKAQDDPDDGDDDDSDNSDSLEEASKPHHSRHDPDDGDDEPDDSDSRVKSSKSGHEEDDSDDDDEDGDDDDDDDHGQSDDRNSRVESRKPRKPQDEYHAHYKPSKALEREVQEAFLDHDVDQNGFLDKSEMATILDHAGLAPDVPPGGPVEKSLWHEWDKNGDGKLSMKELLGFVSDGPDQWKKHQSAEALFQHGQKAIQEGDIRVYPAEDFVKGELEAHDADESGFLERKEVAAFLQEFRVPEDFAWRSHDTDADGRLSFEELMGLVTSQSVDLSD